MRDLVAFYRARLDDAERETRDLGKMFGVDQSGVLRDIEAKRAILDVWEDADRHRYDLPKGVSEGRGPDERLRDDAVAGALDEIVAILAAVCRDHPDYDPAWAV